MAVHKKQAGRQASSSDSDNECMQMQTTSAIMRWEIHNLQVGSHEHCKHVILRYRYWLLTQQAGAMQVQDGDMISIDASSRKMNMDVSDAELQKRRDAWTAPPYKSTRGTLYKYIKNVSSASLGCVTDL